MLDVQTVVLAILVVGAGIYALASGVLWTGARRRSVARHPVASPSVTVIIPARDEARNVPALVRALTAQTYPGDRWEAVLVDDRSKDGTGDLARNLAAMAPASIRVLRIDSVPPHTSPKKHAISRAIAESTGEIILTTDADCRPESGWIASMIATLTASGADLIAGYSPYGRRESLSRRLLALETLSQGFLTMSGIGAGFPITCQGRSFGYRRKVFETVGGFGEATSMLSGDDHLFLQRAVRHGFRAVYCDAAGSRVWTDPPATWRAFVHQRIRMLSGAGHLSFGVAALGATAFGWIAAMLGGMLIGQPVAWAAFAGKAVLDLVSLGIAARRLRETRLLAVYPLAAFLYLPYFLVFALLGTFGSYRWKGGRGS